MNKWLPNLCGPGNLSHIFSILFRNLVLGRLGGQFLNPLRLWIPPCGYPGWSGGIDRAGSLCIDLAIVHGFCLYRIIYKSSNERSRPVKMGGCFLALRFDSKDPAWSNFDFVSYYVCFDANHILFYIISFTGLTS